MVVTLGKTKKNWYFDQVDDLVRWSTQSVTLAHNLHEIVFGDGYKYVSRLNINEISSFSFETGFHKTLRVMVCRDASSMILLYDVVNENNKNHEAICNQIKYFVTQKLFKIFKLIE